VKVEIDTKDKSVYIQANEITRSIVTIDKWIKTLRMAREWLRKDQLPQDDTK
jgi:hypothetical protein